MKVRRAGGVQNIQGVHSQKGDGRRTSTQNKDGAVWESSQAPQRGRPESRDGRRLQRQLVCWRSSTGDVMMVRPSLETRFRAISKPGIHLGCPHLPQTRRRVIDGDLSSTVGSLVMFCTYSTSLEAERNRPSPETARTGTPRWKTSLEVPPTFLSLSCGQARTTKNRNVRKAPSEYNASGVVFKAPGWSLRARPP